LPYADSTERHIAAGTIRWRAASTVVSMVRAGAGKPAHCHLNSFLYLPMALPTPGGAPMMRA